MNKIKPLAGEELMFVINGVVATTYMEMCVVLRRVSQLIKEQGIELVFGRIGEYLTVQEQSGFQMIMAKLDDEKINYLKNKKSDAPYWCNIGK